MPNKYQPLTKEEKQEIARKHKEYVESLNKRITEVQQGIDYVVYDRNDDAQYSEEITPLEFDDTIFDRMEDESEIAVYRISQDIKAIHNEQDSIYKALASEFGPSTSDADLLIRRSFKTGNTPFAREYNEKLYKDFKENPNKVIGMLYRKVLEYNPDKLLNTPDNKVGILEFYQKNHEIIDLADSLSEFKNTAAFKEQNQTFQDLIKGDLAEPLKVMSYPAKLARLGAEKEYFAYPHIYKAQAESIKGFNERNRINDNPLLKEYIDNCADETLTETFYPSRYFESINSQFRNDFGHGFFTNYYMNVNGQKTPFNFLTNPFRSGRITLEKRKDREIYGLTHINKEYEKAYQKNWDKKLKDKIGMQGEFSVDAVKKMHKGGFFENWVFFNTSSAYKNFIKEFEQYHDPNHKDFGNDELLRGRAWAYLLHKGATTEEEISRLKGTAYIRAKLAYETIQCIDSKNEIDYATDKELAAEYPPKREQINNFNNIINNEIDNEIHNEPKIQKQIEEENEFEIDTSNKEPKEVGMSEKL